MKTFAILPLVAALAAIPAFAQSGAAADAPALSLDQRMLIRCSAAFALVANGQESGEEAALTFPDLRERGREFFVRSSAQVMDEAGLDRQQISTILTAEAQDIRDNRSLETVMDVCLGVLNQSGL